MPKCFCRLNTFASIKHIDMKQSIALLKASQIPFCERSPCWTAISTWFAVISRMRLLPVIRITMSSSIYIIRSMGWCHADSPCYSNPNVRNFTTMKMVWIPVSFVNSMDYRIKCTTHREFAWMRRRSLILVSLMPLDWCPCEWEPLGVSSTPQVSWSSNQSTPK